jgi:diacylglycerol kinase (ATP)
LLLREEANAQIHRAATALIILAGLAMLLSADEWRWLIAACAAVWSAEAVNTAVERLCDRVCPDHDPLIGATKDLAAGAVLLTSGCALAIGAAVFLPHLTGALR